MRPPVHETISLEELGIDAIPRFTIDDLYSGPELERVTAFFETTFNKVALIGPASFSVLVKYGHDTLGTEVSQDLTVSLLGNPTDSTAVITQMPGVGPMVFVSWIASQAKLDRQLDDPCADLGDYALPLKIGILEDGVFRIVYSKQYWDESQTQFPTPTPLQ